jgi:2-keto-4-pentenoate hydratase/2-oxohepta-3-ene-1,7-dioic acid hydratase in catechol pathway
LSLKRKRRANQRVGPTLVSAKEIPDVSKLQIKGLKNGNVMQDCQLTYVPFSLSHFLQPFQPLPFGVLPTNFRSDLIFSVPKLVSFLSQGTTLPAGTIILTGTPPGVGAAKNPKEFLKGGDEFRVELSPLVGTLINKIEHQ